MLKMYAWVIFPFCLKISWKSRKKSFITISDESSPYQCSARQKKCDNAGLCTATRRITGSLIGTMGIVTLLPFVQLDGLWKCIYDTFPGAAAAFNAASFHIELIRLEIYIFRNCIEGSPTYLILLPRIPLPQFLAYVRASGRFLC